MSRSTDPSSWERWRERLRRFESCNLTVAAYCQAEGVSQAGFYLWRKKLRAGAAPGLRRGKPTKPTSTKLAFVPVVATSFTSVVVVTLTNGVRVELPAVDHELVSHVVQVAAATASAGGDS